MIKKINGGEEKGHEKEKTCSSNKRKCFCVVAGVVVVVVVVFDVMKKRVGKSKRRGGRCQCERRVAIESKREEDKTNLTCVEVTCVILDGEGRRTNDGN